MKIWDNKKGLSSALAIIFLVVLSSGMGSGLWLFSQAEIVNFGGAVGINIEEQAVKVTITELSKDPQDFLNKKVLVKGTVVRREDNACVIVDNDQEFSLSCWAPLYAPPPVNTNAQLAETRTMDFYYNKKWQLTGLVKNEGGKYYLAVEAYSLVE